MRNRDSFIQEIRKIKVYYDSLLCVLPQFYIATTAGRMDDGKMVAQEIIAHCRTSVMSLYQQQTRSLSEEEMIILENYLRRQDLVLEHYEKLFSRIKDGPTTTNQ